MSNIPPGAGALLGQRLGNFEIVALLALGGTAEIYLAKVAGDSGFEKYVVVKCLHDYLADDEEFVKMFLDEARLAANLNHSNIAQTLGLGEHENRYFMVMEYLVGMSLAMVARRGGERLPGGVLPISTSLNLMQQACGGLHYAHEFSQNGASMQIVHRDISPQNLVVTFEGIIKVVDFGIAKAEQRETQTKSGTIKGKFAYMSPEQCIAQGVDRRTDVFALGIIMHELLTGKRLFKRPNPYDTYQAVIDCKVLAPSKLNHGLDAAIDSIVLRALSKNKEDRYPTAEAMGDDILAYMHQQGSSGGQGEIGKFFEQHFETEIAEHYERMRDLIAGEQSAPVSVEGAWDAPPAGARAGSRGESLAEPVEVVNVQDVEPAKPKSRAPSQMMAATPAAGPIPATTAPMMTTPAKPILPTMPAPAPSLPRMPALGAVPSVVPRLAVPSAIPKIGPPSVSAPFDPKKTQFGIGKPAVKVPSAIPAIAKPRGPKRESATIAMTAPHEFAQSSAQTAMTTTDIVEPAVKRAITETGPAVRTASPHVIARNATPIPRSSDDLSTPLLAPNPIVTPRAATPVPVPLNMGAIVDAHIADAHIAPSIADSTAAELVADDSVIEESSVRSEVSALSQLTAELQQSQLPPHIGELDVGFTTNEDDFQGEATQIEASPPVATKIRAIPVAADEQTRDHDTDYSSQPASAARPLDGAFAMTVPIDNFVAVGQQDKNANQRTGADQQAREQARAWQPSSEYPVVPSVYPGYQPTDQYGKPLPQQQPPQPQQYQQQAQYLQQQESPQQYQQQQQQQWGHEGTTPTPISVIGRPLSGSFQAVGYPLNTTPLAASPVGDKYSKQVDWNAAAAQRAKAVQLWLLALLFAVSLLAALTLTVVVRRFL
jgi:tRNA A-37 threonylcarbamoyl transferase component Bud32